MVTSVGISKLTQYVILKKNQSDLLGKFMWIIRLLNPGLPDWPCDDTHWAKLAISQLLWPPGKCCCGHFNNLAMKTWLFLLIWTDNDNVFHWFVYFHWLTHTYINVYWYIHRRRIHRRTTPLIYWEEKCLNKRHATWTNQIQSLGWGAWRK